MTTPVSHVELNSPDPKATAAFMREVFGWGAATVRGARLTTLP